MTLVQNGCLQFVHVWEQIIPSIHKAMWHIQKEAKAMRLNPTTKAMHLNPTTGRERFLWIDTDIYVYAMRQ